MKLMPSVRLAAIGMLILATTQANAQVMRVKMVQHGGFHHHRLKYFGPAPMAQFSPIGVPSGMPQPGAAAGVNPIDVINLIGRLRDGGGRFGDGFGGGGNAQLSSRIETVEANVRTLSTRVDDLTARIEKLESRVEENRRTRVLVEQHDQAIRALWKHNQMPPLPNP